MCVCCALWGVKQARGHLTKDIILMIVVHHRVGVSMMKVLLSSIPYTDRDLDHKKVSRILGACWLEWIPQLKISSAFPFAFSLSRRGTEQCYTILVRKKGQVSHWGSIYQKPRRSAKAEDWRPNDLSTKEKAVLLHL